MSSVERMVMANDAGFQRRVKHFMQTKAVAVLAEETPDATEAAYAKLVLTGQASIYEFACAACTNATIAAAIDTGAAITDNDLGYVVMTQMFDEMAKANA